MDIYQQHGIHAIGRDIDLREAYKLFMLTALNAHDEATTFQAIRFQKET